MSVIESTCDLNAPITEPGIKGPKQAASPSEDPVFDYPVVHGLDPVVPEHHHAGQVILGRQEQIIDARPLLTYLWGETDRAASEVTDPSKETGKSLGQLDALRAVTRQVTKMALGME